MGVRRIKRLSNYVCVCVEMCRQKTQLFTVLLLENHHSIVRFCNFYSSMPTQLDESSVECYSHGLAAWPRGGI